MPSPLKTPMQRVRFLFPGFKNVSLILEVIYDPGSNYGKQIGRKDGRREKTKKSIRNLPIQHLGSGFLEFSHVI